MQYTIMVVDDDKKTVDLIRLYLEKERYQVIVAYDGQEALELARQKPPSLIILDWMSVVFSAPKRTLPLFY